MKKISLLIMFFMPIIAFVKEINVIWLCPERMWENDWIWELLSDSKATIREFFDGNYQIVLDHSLIVTSYPDKDKYQQYYQAFRDKGYKFGIIHLSDEAYGHPLDFYPGAQFVLRNYWHKKIQQPNLLAFPLGYKKDFWKNYASHRTLPSASDRKYTWSFAGTIKKTTREVMYAHLARIRNHFVHEIPHFNAASGLSAEEYRELLLDTIFVPCPRGNFNIDSFRLCEALECGCIPIVEKNPFDYFKCLVGEHPFLAVNHWREAPRMIKNLLARPDQLEDLRKRCHSFWMAHKQHLKTTIAEWVENSL